MSSTTSSDYENCDCWKCTYLLENNLNNYGKSSRHIPIYATMAHPLIYYAEVQQPPNGRPPNHNPRKENPNLFVKAFKWYTQERAPSNKHDIVPERSGFANWLDNKYIEYLRESGQRSTTPTSHKPQLQKNATIESGPPNLAKIARNGFKSPWRKRKRRSNDLRDAPKKVPDQSCDFILKPKDLSRAASDTCYNTSGGKSNATVASSKPCNLESGKSHSLGSVSRERSLPKHVDTIPHTELEGPKAQEQEMCYENQVVQIPLKKQNPIELPRTICMCHQEHVPEVVQVPSKSRAVDVLCQCPEEKIIPVNKETQYEPPKSQRPSITNNFAPSAYNGTPMPPPIPCCVSESGKILKAEMNATPAQNKALEKQKQVKRLSVSCQCAEEAKATVDNQSQHQPDPCARTSSCRDYHEMNQVLGPISTRHQSRSTVAINKETGEISMEVAVVSKFTRSVTCVANDVAQTSDHSICFGKDETCPCPYYPLFLKIVYADRLNNECCN